jgi:hypothetical protein
MYDYNIKKLNNKLILNISIPLRRREPLIVIDAEEIKKILLSNKINVAEWNEIEGRVITNDIPPYETTWIFEKKVKFPSSQPKKVDKSTKNMLSFDSSNNTTKKE